MSSGNWLKGKSNEVCPSCGKGMTLPFIGLEHCRFGMSWKKDIGFFERIPGMGFVLERRANDKKVKQVPVIRCLE